VESEHIVPSFLARDIRDGQHSGPDRYSNPLLVGDAIIRVSEVVFMTAKFGSVICFQRCYFGDSRFLQLRQSSFDRSQSRGHAGDTALAGGAVFTVIEMQRLGNEGR
jgi:hypothetical protein